MAAESALEKYCGRKVAWWGGEFIKAKWVGRRGCPDRLLWLPWMEEPIWVEFKAPNGALRVNQKREHTRLRKMGMLVFVWYTREQVDEFIKKPKHT